VKNLFNKLFNKLLNMSYQSEEIECEVCGKQYYSRCPFCHVPLCENHDNCEGCSVEDCNGLCDLCEVCFIRNNGLVCKLCKIRYCNYHFPENFNFEYNLCYKCFNEEYEEIFKNNFTLSLKELLENTKNLF